jgi:hypothetical protein
MYCAPLWSTSRVTDGTSVVWHAIHQCTAKQITFLLVSRAESEPNGDHRSERVVMNLWEVEHESLTRLHILFINIFPYTCPGLSSDLFLKDIPTKILHTFLISPARITCPAHSTHLNVSLTILGVEYTLWSSSLCNFLHVLSRYSAGLRIGRSEF